MQQMFHNYGFFLCEKYLKFKCTEVIYKNIFTIFYKFTIYDVINISCFYTENNIRSSKLQQQCKNGKMSKIILKTVFLFVNVKTEDGWDLSLRQEKANLDERKESNRQILPNIMLIFVCFFICSRWRTLVS